LSKKLAEPSPLRPRSKKSGSLTPAAAESDVDMEAEGVAQILLRTTPNPDERNDALSAEAARLQDPSNPAIDVEVKLEEQVTHSLGDLRENVPDTASCLSEDEDLVNSPLYDLAVQFLNEWVSHPYAAPHPF